MYGKALLPESREDIMRLLESVDKILGHFETILHMIEDQQIELPDFIVPKIDELFTSSLESCDLMLEQVEALFSSTQKGIRELVARIDLLESRCDHIERNLIRAVFGSDLDVYQKIQIKQVILQIGDISDQVDRCQSGQYHSHEEDCIMFSLLGGIFLGWSLGANDASNVFGSAVTSRMLKF